MTYYQHDPFPFFASVYFQSMEIMKKQDSQGETQNEGFLFIEIFD